MSTQSINVPGMSRLCQTMKETEEPEVVSLVGEPLPHYVTGIYLRTGPALFDLKGYGCMRHLFDGYAMLCKLEIDAVNNKVSLTKKFLQSDSYKRAVAASKPVIGEFATAPRPDPHQSFFSKIAKTLSPEFSDNNNSNITTLGPDVYTFGDTCYFREVDPLDLSSKDKQDTNKLFNLHVQCAHPLTDPDTGDVWNIGYSVYTGLKFNIFKMSAAKRSQDMFKTAKIMATVHSRWAGSMASVHSFGMTQNFIILVEQPFVVCVGKIAASIFKKNAIYEAMEWNGHEKNRFVLIHKSGHVQHIEYFSEKSFHYLHILNSYEDTENEQIIIDINTYPSPSYLNALYVSKLRSNTLEIVPDELPQIQRFIIPLFDDNTTKMDQLPENVNLVKGGRGHPKASAMRQGNKIILTPHPMAEKGLDMAITPAVPPGKKHDYFYAASILSQNSVRNKIYKISCNQQDPPAEQQQQVSWWTQDEFTFIVGEPRFIPDPTPGVEQDEGVLVCPIIDLRTDNQDFVVFLDKNMKEICRATFTQELPIAFHGIFIQPRPSPPPPPHNDDSNKSSSIMAAESFVAAVLPPGGRKKHKKSQEIKKKKQ